MDAGGTYTSIPVVDWIGKIYPSWSLYLIDKSTGKIVQRYPGIYTNEEFNQAEIDMEHMNERLDLARYIICIMRYDSTWVAPH